MLLLSCKDVNSVVCLIVKSCVTETTLLNCNSPLGLSCNSLLNDKMWSNEVIWIIVEFFELDDLPFIVDSNASNLDSSALVKLNHLC